MGKGILGVVAGLAVWMMVVSAAWWVLRAAWPEYVSAAGTMTFTASMKVARLSIGALATLAAGWVPALVAFIPEHIMLWDKFPVWYHMTFLLSLVPLTYAGGRIPPVSI
jgi:glycerol-3-phosphate acyltransferase PlsY